MVRNRKWKIRLEVKMMTNPSTFTAFFVTQVIDLFISYPSLDCKSPFICILFICSIVLLLYFLIDQTSS